MAEKFCSVQKAPTNAIWIPTNVHWKPNQLRHRELFQLVVHYLKIGIKSLYLRCVQVFLTLANRRSVILYIKSIITNNKAVCKKIFWYLGDLTKLTSSEYEPRSNNSLPKNSIQFSSSIKNFPFLIIFFRGFHFHRLRHFAGFSYNEWFSHFFPTKSAIN